MCLLSVLQYKTQYNYDNRRGGARCGAEPATDPPRLPISSTRRAFPHVNASQKRAQTPRLVHSSRVRQQQARSAAASSHIQQQPAVMCSARATPMLIYTQTSCLVKSLAGSLRNRTVRQGLDGRPSSRPCCTAPAHAPASWPACTGPTSKGPLQSSVTRRA